MLLEELWLFTQFITYWQYTIRNADYSLPEYLMILSHLSQVRIAWLVSLRKYLHDVQSRENYLRLPNACEQQTGSKQCILKAQFIQLWIETNKPLPSLFKRMGHKLNEKSIMIGDVLCQANQMSSL